MSRHPLMDQMKPFNGTRLVDVIEQIKAIAAEHQCTVNVIGPQFKAGNIDNEAHRLNVRTNKDGNIWLFTIG